MFVLSKLVQINLCKKSMINTTRDVLLEEVLQGKNKLVHELRTEAEKTLQPQLQILSSQYGFNLPWTKISKRLNEVDLEKHLTQALAAMESMQTAHTLLNFAGALPSISSEELQTLNVENRFKIRVVSGLMLPPRVQPRGAFFLGYIIASRNIEVFEEMEGLVPDAGYRALIPPGRPNSEEARNFFTSPKRCLASLEKFREGVKKYLVFDRGFRDEYTYSVHVRIAEVDLDLELWLKWKPKRIEIRKQMNQETSMPPRRVIEYLERDEDLEVVAIRLPKWLKNKLEDEASSKHEQLGTHLREQLEHLYT